MRWIRWPGLRPLLCNPIDRHRVPLTPSIRSLSSHISALCFFPSRFTQLTLPTAPATLEVFFFSSSIEFPPAPERERGGQDEHSRRAHPVVVLFAYGCENEARAHYIRRQVCICSCETTGASIYITCLVRLSECFFLCVCGGLDGRIYTAGVLYPNRYPADNPTSRLMFWLCVYCSDRGIIYIYIHIVGERLLARVKSILVPSRETCDFQPRICMSRPCDYTSQRRMRYYRQQPGNKDIAMHTYS